MTKRSKRFCFKFWLLEFICDLACAREAPPCWAKAGTWNMVFLLYCLMLIRVKIPARPKRIVGIHEERKGESTPDFPKERKI